MIALLRMLFCRHKQEQQRSWGGNETAWLCLRCGRIKFRKTAGGPPPPGTQFRYGGARIHWDDRD